MSERSNILELHALDGEETLFSRDDSYVVPIYQRAFAWTDVEIEQLIDDINDFDSRQNTDSAGANSYYLGSLIVNAKKDDSEHEVCEVIDGQQRLTTLFLLLSYLGLLKDADTGRLRFECRGKSNYTLENINNIASADSDRVETALLSGRKAIEEKFQRGDGIDKNEFISKLQRVIIFRIEVPPRTDLNRYFEIMNTRGEQLEPTDILKARIMDMCDRDNDREREWFARVWDACRDMDGYVQMHFDTTTRVKLFGRDWNSLAPIKDVIDSQEDSSSSSDGKTAIELIEDDGRVSFSNSEKEIDPETSRFKSIISFPVFLLHVLNVFTHEQSWVRQSFESEQLDDAQLLSRFESVQNDWWCANRDKKEFPLAFIECLLKCRMLFDKYIIQSEFSGKDSDGVWSLKQLNRSNDDNASYSNTCFKKKGGWSKTYDNSPLFNNIRMMQACLRVSYTAPKSMHWITDLLNWLYDDDNLGRLPDFEGVVEDIIRSVVKPFVDSEDYQLGVGTPHIVLNYLDYLLWKERGKYKDLNFGDFEFNFNRNSIEHWYPQHPSEGSFPMWNQPDVDMLGNLCLVSSKVNSKFSNLAPTSKKSTYMDMIAGGSLKLRLMARDTKDDSEWKNQKCKEHEKEMLELLGGKKQYAGS